MKSIISTILILLFFACGSGKHQVSRQKSFGKDSISVNHFQQKEKAKLLHNLIASTCEIRHIRFSIPDSTGQQFIEEYTELAGRQDQISSQETCETQIDKESLYQSQSLHLQTEKNKKSHPVHLYKGILILGILYLLFWKKK